jgi:hypothetical protein
VDLVEEEDRPPAVRLQPLAALVDHLGARPSRRRSPPTARSKAASTWAAITRAIEVLPDPGGPHRIIDTGRPDPHHGPRRRPREPSKVRLPDDLVEVTRDASAPPAARPTPPGAPVRLGEEVVHQSGRVFRPRAPPDLGTQIDAQLGELFVGPTGPAMP